LFIGCSSEAKLVADALQENLEDAFEVTVWYQGVFGLSKTTIESLEERLDGTDFSVFVVSPDDHTTQRGVTVFTPRDNVVFELGLFIGRLGRDRCYMVAPRKTETSFPSDLYGVTIAFYDDARSDADLVAAVATAANKIRRAAEVRRGCSFNVPKCALNDAMRLFLSGSAYGENCVVVCWKNDGAASGGSRRFYCSNPIAIEDDHTWSVSFDLTPGTAPYREVVALLCSESSAREIKSKVEGTLIIKPQQLLKAVRDLSPAHSAPIVVSKS
jgi:hypothetical protein